jgi:hypothetical protein
MKSLALILGLLAAIHVYNITVELCTAVLFELAVEIMKTCGSSHSESRISIFINKIHESRWKFMSDGIN